MTIAAGCRRSGPRQLGGGAALNAAGLGIELVYAVRRPDVNASVDTLCNVRSVVAEEPLRRRVRHEAGMFRCRRIHSRQATIRCHPEPPCTVKVQVINRASSNSIAWGKDSEPSAGKPRQRTIAKPYPKIALPVFAKAGGRSRRRQAISVRVSVKRLGRALPSGERVPAERKRVHPDVPVRVFEEYPNVIVGQARRQSYKTPWGAHGRVLQPTSLLRSGKDHVLSLPTILLRGLR